MTLIPPSPSAPLVAPSEPSVTGTALPAVPPESDGVDGALPAAPAEHGLRLRLTPSALREVQALLEEEDLLDEGGLRISATTGAGCSTPLRFNLELDVGPEPGDLVLEGGGIRIFIDPRSAWSVDGLEVDWADLPGMGEGFTFRHPRGVGGRCGV